MAQKAKQPSLKQVKTSQLSAESARDIELMTTAVKEKEPDAPDLSSSDANLEDNSQILGEVNECLDLLQNIDRKMLKYEATDQSIIQKFDAMIKTTTAVNDLASES